MRIALYIEDGHEQMVLTPETETEKSLLDKLHDGNRIVSIHKGGFYHCRGGWLREGADQDSTMLVLKARNEAVK